MPNGMWICEAKWWFSWVGARFSQWDCVASIEAGKQAMTWAPKRHGDSLYPLTWHDTEEKALTMQKQVQSYFGCLKETA